jgi:uncharacterized membrane protein
MNNSNAIPSPHRSSTFPQSALASLACMATAMSAFAQPHYAVTDLGVLPGYGLSVASSITDRGDIAGYCATSSNFSTTEAVIWHNGQLINVGRLAGGNYSTANAINAAGVVVGDGDTGNFRPQSWVTTASGLYNFFPNNGGNTHALFIGDDGFIGGYYTKSLSGNTASWRGSIWTPDPKDPRKYRQVDLPVLPGINSKFTSVIPWAFNQSGQAAGWAANDIIGQHACFWMNDAKHTIVDLGTYPGDWSSLAWGMNDLGQVVGESHPPFANRAILWNNDPVHTPTELPLLPGDNMGSASRINNLGHALGWSALSLDGTSNNLGPERPVLWRDGGVVELQSVLDAVSGAGWTISIASGINNLGQIVGLGIHNGKTRAYLLTPMN